MKRIAWREGLTLPHDPQDSEVYQWDWSDWLDGDTLAGSPTILADPGITAALEYLAAQTVDVRISGGIAGTTYAVTVRATSTPRGRIADRTVRFDCHER